MQGQTNQEERGPECQNIVSLFPITILASELKADGIALSPWSVGLDSVMVKEVPVVAARQAPGPGRGRMMCSPRVSTAAGRFITRLGPPSLDLHWQSAALRSLFIGHRSLSLPSSSSLARI